MEDINREEKDHIDGEEQDTASVVVETDCEDKNPDETVDGSDRNADPQSEETKEEVQGKNRRTRTKKDGRSGFIKGVAAGIVLCLIAGLLYRGYVYLPVGKNGEILVKFPYYEALHGNKEDGELDTTDILRKTYEIKDLIKRNYLYEQNPQRISDGMFTGLIYGLVGDDSYAAYYSAHNYESEQKSLKGSYVGIGVAVTKDDANGGVLVGNVTAGGPAESAGIKAGDIITEADGKSLAELSLDECVALISGEEGTEVALKLKRGEEELELSVKRETIKEISVRYEVAKGTNIGYLSISSFTPTTEQDFYAAMDELAENKQVDGMIIDLRNNSGGDMNVALRMVDEILKDDLGDDGKTLLLNIEDKNGELEPYYAEDGHSQELPIVVLVNGNSASASEIFSGVLKDYGYTVIGEKTFGKGIVQSIYQLSDGSAVKFTTDYYILPNGERIHGVGIEPSITVPFENYGDMTSDKVNYAGNDNEPDFDNDIQLRTALDNIMEQIYS